MFNYFKELGYSNSAYSLRDQLKVNPIFTPPNASKPVDWTDVEEFIHFLEYDWSILSMADLVYNHTSNDSPWLHKHPECAYNVVNSPHLVSAYLLDHIIWNLTRQAADGALRDRGIPTVLSNPDTELPAISRWLWDEINGAKLYEYFLADVEEVQNEFTVWLRKFARVSLLVPHECCSCVCVCVN